MDELRLSNEQVRHIACAICHDIRQYVDSHHGEFAEFVRDKQSGNHLKTKLSREGNSRQTDTEGAIGEILSSHAVKSHPAI